MHVPIYPYVINEGKRNCSACDRRSSETVTLRKNVTKYKRKRKWMVRFLRKLENRGIKIFILYREVYMKKKKKEKEKNVYSN